MRTIDVAVADALERGAITQESATWWLSQGNDAVDTVDMLTGSPVLAAAAPWGPQRRVATDGYGPAGPVTAASVPPGADPALYGPNPLLEEVRGLRPELVQAALAENPDPPRLFGNADLPPFTASGLDPVHLARVPWPLRRPMAEAPTLAAAYQLQAKYEDNPDMARVDLAHDLVNASYVEAFSNWLAGTGRHPDDLALPGTGVAASGAAAYTAEQLHQELFGPRSGDWGDRE
jgi:hypothetical protein